MSMLLTENLPFRAILRADRAIQVTDTERYAFVLSRSRAVLNISRDAVDIHLVTGRVFETIAAGSLLVEQSNPAATQFFQPYRHFLPWSNLADIAHIAQFIERRPDLATKIAEEAHQFSRENYGAFSFWTSIINHAMRPISSDDLAWDSANADKWIPLANMSDILQLKELFTDRNGL